VTDPKWKPLRMTAPFVETLFTVPVTTLALALVGGVVLARRRRGEPVGPDAEPEVPEGAPTAPDWQRPGADVDRAPLASGRAVHLGMLSRAELLDAYEESCGVRVDPEVLRWWEVFGTLKWGVICIMQADVHLSGASRSHELAAIGRRVCENEYDLLLVLP